MVRADHILKQAEIFHNSVAMCKLGYDYNDPEQRKAFLMRNTLIVLDDFIEACKAAGRSKECLNSTVNDTNKIFENLDYDSEEFQRIQNMYDPLRFGKWNPSAVFGIETETMTIKEIQKKLKEGAKKLKKEKKKKKDI